MNFRTGLFAGVPRRFLLLGLLAACALADTGASHAAQGLPPGYTQYFSDEFNTPGAPNPNRWRYNLGVINNELQCYTADRLENVRVEDRTFNNVTGGYLVLELRKEPWTCTQDNNKLFQYTSGSITTKNGQYHLNDPDPEVGMPFGIYEIRAKIPSGRGTWPALWLVGKREWYQPGGVLGWPSAGEIDIMEHLGFEEENGLYRHHSALHRNKSYIWPNGWHNASGQGMILDFKEPLSKDFHIWKMIWEPDSIRMYVDDVLVDQMIMPGDKHETRNGFQRSDPGMNAPASDSLSWPFSKEMGNEFTLILNLAWGGGWGGREGIDDTIFDAGAVEMLVDYVRIYTKNQAQALLPPDHFEVIGR